jgi:hypothetical protein
MITGLLLVSAGCIMPLAGRSITAEEQEQIRNATREFLDDQNYTPDENLMTVDGHLFRLDSEGSMFFIELSNHTVVRAEFTTPSAVARVEASPLHAKAVEGIRAFLQNEEYYPHATRITFFEDRYQIEGPGILFRVNTTSGVVTVAELKGEEAVGAIEQSEQYRKVKEAVNSSSST